MSICSLVSEISTRAQPVIPFTSSSSLHIRIYDFSTSTGGLRDERRARDKRGTDVICMSVRNYKRKPDMDCSPLLFVPRVIFDAKVDHREGKHHASCGQRPRREEDVHVSVATPVSKSPVEFGSKVMWETHGKPTASARHTPAEPEDWRHLSG